MPIDINRLRADKGGNLEAVRADQQKRFKPAELVDNILAVDVRWREVITLRDQLRQDLNALQKNVIAPKKKQKLPCDEDIATAEAMKNQLQQLELDLSNLDKERSEKLALLGNNVEESVPVSSDENDGLVTSVWPPMEEGCTLPCAVREFAGHQPVKKPLTHEELLWRIGGYDPERGAKVAGGRGYFLQGVAVQLNQALINYALNFLLFRGYTAIQPPYFMRKDLMASVAQLSDFDEQLYKVSAKPDCPEDDKYLIATSEQPLCAYHSKETLEEGELPKRYAGVSMCFRKEVGKMNQEIRGIFRVHQFEKVEQFMVTRGDISASRVAHEEMLHCAEEFHQSLGLPYRVVSIVSGELNDAAVAKFDLEGWFHGQCAYRELVSCSNCTDYQSRALEIRARSAASCGRKAPSAAAAAASSSSSSSLSYVHMLNSTLTATGRGICCILEAYQAEDGVSIPEVLIPYMGGMTFIPFIREPQGKT